MCKDSDIQKLQVLQNRAMRIILKCHKRTHQYLSKNSQNNVFFKGVKEYNNIPQEIKNSATTDIFKLKCICKNQILTS